MSTYGQYIPHHHHAHGLVIARQCCLLTPRPLSSESGPCCSVLVYMSVDNTKAFEFVLHNLAAA